MSLKEPTPTPITPPTGRHREVVGLGEDERLIESVAKTVEAVTKGASSVRIEFVHLPPRHVGLGTGTAIHLAAAAAAVNATGLSFDTDHMATLSKRGGASGIGVNAFAVGGVIFDGGHSFDRRQPYRPSSHSAPHRLPPVVTRLTLPSQWQVSLILPPGNIVAGQDELQFFQQELPLPRDESLSAIAWAYHGVATAIVEADLTSLASAIRALNSIGMKKRELAHQADVVRTTLRHLQSLPTIAAGMSSFGPLLYAISDVRDTLSSVHIYETAAAYDARVITASINNHGHRIEDANAF
ncbi:hypothetical protein F4Y93_13735 [Candidatus Poribacteria bacterium]|nr:hypothetical protein [Candidatus Poribacteria bacterium]